MGEFVEQQPITASVPQVGKTPAFSPLGTVQVDVKPVRMGLVGLAPVFPAQRFAQSELLSALGYDGNETAARIFQGAGIEVEFRGKDLEEIGVDTATGKTVMRISPKFHRPAEVDLLIGSAEKAERILGWKPQTSLEQLCQMMVREDLRRNERGFSF